MSGEENAIVVRRYTPGDAEAIAQLWLRAWKKTMPEINFDARLAWWHAYWRDEIVLHARIFVAERSGVIIGFYTLDDAKYMDQFLVTPDEWGSGVALLLMNDAKRESPRGITLKVNDENPRAIRFYEKNGFKKVNSETNNSRRLVWNMKWCP